MFAAAREAYVWRCGAKRFYARRYRSAAAQSAPVAGDIRAAGALRRCGGKQAVPDFAPRATQRSIEQAGHSQAHLSRASASADHARPAGRAVPFAVVALSHGVEFLFFASAISRV